MPRFFFHVRDGTDIPDHTGTELPDMDAVRANAVASAGEAIRDLGSKFWDEKDWELQVTDEAGQQVLTLTFKGYGAAA